MSAQPERRSSISPIQLSNDFVAVNQYTVEGDRTHAAPTSCFRQRAPSRAHRAEGARRGTGNAARCLRSAPHVRSRDSRAPRVQRRAASSRLARRLGWDRSRSDSSTSPLGRRLTARGWPRQVSRRWRSSSEGYSSQPASSTSCGTSSASPTSATGSSSVLPSTTSSTLSTRPWARPSAAMERGDGRAGVVWHTQGAGRAWRCSSTSAR